jgi:hypothetical protein
MMSRWKKVLLTIAILVVGLFAFLSWYKFHYSMKSVEAFAVNNPGLTQHVLIATQGSAYKDAIVAGLVADLKSRPVYIRVIDVSGLSEIREQDWDVIVVLHNWENWKPQPDAAAFIKRVADKNKLIVVSTSGDGDMKIEGVDAITSASKMDEVPAHLALIQKRINALLQP